MKASSALPLGGLLVLLLVLGAPAASVELSFQRHGRVLLERLWPSQFLPSRNIKGVLDFIGSLTAADVKSYATKIQAQVDSATTALTNASTTLVDDGLKVATPTLKAFLATKTGGQVAERLLADGYVDLTKLGAATNTAGLSAALGANADALDFATVLQSSIDQITTAVDEGKLTFGDVAADTLTAIAGLASAIIDNYSSNDLLKKALTADNIADLTLVRDDINGLLSADSGLKVYVDQHVDAALETLDCIDSGKGYQYKENMLATSWNQAWTTQAAKDGSCTFLAANVDLRRRRARALLETDEEKAQRLAEELANQLKDSLGGMAGADSSSGDSGNSPSSSSASSSGDYSSGDYSGEGSGEGGDGNAGDGNGGGGGKGGLGFSVDPGALLADGFSAADGLFSALTSSADLPTTLSNAFGCVQLVWNEFKDSSFAKKLGKDISDANTLNVVPADANQNAWIAINAFLLKNTSNAVVGTFTNTGTTGNSTDKTSRQSSVRVVMQMLRSAAANLASLGSSDSKSFQAAIKKKLRAALPASIRNSTQISVTGISVSNARRSLLQAQSSVAVDSTITLPAGSTLDPDAAAAAAADSIKAAIAKDSTLLALYGIDPNSIAGETDNGNDDDKKKKLKLGLGIGLGVGGGLILIAIIVIVVVKSRKGSKGVAPA